MNTESAANHQGMKIHPSAIVSETAQIGKGVEIGPYCVVGKNVTLHDRVRLVSHVCIDGHTEVGEETLIYPFASIGLAPQDLKYKGEASQLMIGKRNKIREYVTMQPGTAAGDLITTVGDDGLFMASSHVAHDCQLGDHVIMANNATLAGHVRVGTGAIIGGLAAVHQFVRIGPYAMIGGMCAIKNDVIPYGAVSVQESSLSGINLIGLKRQGVLKREIAQFREAFDRLFFGDDGVFSERLEKARDAYKDFPRIMETIDFLSSESSRALCLPRK